MINDWETIEVQSIIDENARLRKENEQLKQKNKKLADALTVYFQSKIKGDAE